MDELKRLLEDINSTEIGSQIGNNNLENWCWAIRREIEFTVEQIIEAEEEYYSNGFRGGKIYGRDK